METNRIKERLLKMYRLATDGVDGEAAYEVAKQIAEWKDFQFKYAIKDYIANCKKVGDYESASAL